MVEYDSADRERRRRELIERLLGDVPAVRRAAEYWNEQTLDDVAERWPRIDMQPYRDGPASRTAPRADSPAPP